MQTTLDLKQIKDLFVLVRVKLISHTKLWLLFIGIILVSVIGSAAGAFSTGIQEKSFYLGDERDVVVITQPGASTPITSRVSKYISNDLAVMQGVQGVSPETLGLCLISNRNEEAITVRGITKSYFQITAVNISEGTWLFENQFNRSTVLNNVVIGNTLRRELGLSVRDKIILSSTITDAFMELTIVGALTATNTPIDEEIFVALENGQVLNGLNLGEVTMIRVKYDSAQISENTIKQSLSTLYQLEVHVNSKYLDTYLTLSQFSVKIMTITNELIAKHDFTDDSNSELQLDLPFGRYKIVLVPTFDSLYFAQQFKEILLDQDTTLTFDLDEDIDNLKVKTRYNGSILPAIPVRLTNEYIGDKTILETTELGEINFPISNRMEYSVSAEYNGITRSKSVEGGTTAITFDFLNMLLLQVKNSTTNLAIPDVSVQVSSENKSKTYVTDAAGRVSCNITQSKGKISITYQTYQWMKSYDLTSTTQQVGPVRLIFSEIWLGKTDLTIITQNSSEEPVAGVNATIKDIKTGEMYAGFTNASGILRLQGLVIGNLYEYTLDNGSYIYQGFISLARNQSFTFSFGGAVTSKNFTIIVTNSTTGAPIPNARVEVYDFNTNELYGNKTTNSQGKVVVYSLNSFESRIVVKAATFTYEEICTITPAATKQIYLGDIQFIVRTLNTFQNPLNGLEVTLTQNGYEKTQLTNETGYSEFLLPFGDFNVTVYYEDIDSEKTMTYTPRSGQTLLLTVTFYDSTPMTLVLHDKEGKKIEDAVITVYTSNQTKQLYKALTDKDGKIVLVGITAAVYVVKIEFQGASFTQQIDLTTSDATVALYLGIELSDLIALNYNKWPGLRNYQVSTSQEYIDKFIDTSLSVVSITIFTTIIIITTLSVFSIRSVVLFPLEQEAKKIVPILNKLGATKQQIAVAISLQFTLLSFIAAIIGVFVGHYLVIGISYIGVTKIAGIFFYPQVDFLLVFFIITTICVIIWYTAFTFIRNMDLS